VILSKWSACRCQRRRIDRLAAVDECQAKTDEEPVNTRPAGWGLPIAHPCLSALKQGIWGADRRAPYSIDDLLSGQNNLAGYQNKHPQKTGKLYRQYLSAPEFVRHQRSKPCFQVPSQGGHHHGSSVAVQVAYRYPHGIHTFLQLRNYVHDLNPVLLVPSGNDGMRGAGTATAKRRQVPAFLSVLLFGIEPWVVHHLSLQDIGHTADGSSHGRSTGSEGAIADEWRATTPA